MFQFSFVWAILRKVVTSREGPILFFLREKTALLTVFCVVVFPWDGGKMPRRGLGKFLKRDHQRLRKKHARLKMEEERRRPEARDLKDKDTAREAWPASKAERSLRMSQREKKDAEMDSVR